MASACWNCHEGKAASRAEGARGRHVTSQSPAATGLLLARSLLWPEGGRDREREADPGGQRLSPYRSALLELIRVSPPKA